MPQYRAGLAAVYFTLTNIARCMVPQPEQPARACHTLNIPSSEIGSNEVARLDGTSVKKAAEFLDKVAIMGSADLCTSDRDDTREYARAMTEFASEMESA